VTVEGEIPTAKLGRRFWYTLYKDSMGELRKQLEGVATDQDSASADVVLANYLSEGERWKQRHEAMREELVAVFGGENNGAYNQCKPTFSDRVKHESSNLWFGS